jgi:hypothetical protein
MLLLPTPNVSATAARWGFFEGWPYPGRRAKLLLESVQKYVFPGSRQPRLSEIAASIEKNGLILIENITVFYWLTRFQRNRAGLSPHRYAPVFQRMWEYRLFCGSQPPRLWIAQSIKSCSKMIVPEKFF